MVAKRGIESKCVMGQQLIVRHVVVVRLQAPTNQRRRHEAAGGYPSAEALDPTIARGVDLVVDGGATPGGRPSTLLDLTGERPRIVRAGAVPAEDLTRVLGFPPRSA